MKSKKVNKSSLSRRDFLKINAVYAGGIILYNTGPAFSNRSWSESVLTPKLIGKLKRDDTASPLDDSRWYTAEDVGDGLNYEIERGSLARAKYLVADILLDGQNLCVFNVSLKEGPKGSVFTLRFGLINQCSARIRLPLSLVDMNRWRIDREGAWLKPTCGGERVDLEKVDRITLEVLRKDSMPVRWCMTPLKISTEEVQKLENLILPKGKLLDEMGQSTLRTWSGKSSSAEKVTQRIQSQFTKSSGQKWPEQFSRWGGWKNSQFEATGFFRTEFSDSRWWIVDPDGQAFWSAGCDCVRSGIDAYVGEMLPALSFVPDKDSSFAKVYGQDGQSINFLGINFIRAFGAKSWKEKWAQIALSELRRIGFNTVGNWSEWEITRISNFPYVRPLYFNPKRIKEIYRDFPDVFDPAFEEDAADYAMQLNSTVEDQSLIGYFMMNEPEWGFSNELPALGMLLNTPDSYTRGALSDFLKQKYDDKSVLARAWDIPVNFEQVASGEWRWPLKGQSKKDLEAFSEVMVERFFVILQNACRKIDNNHMNLGIRYQGIPPKWALKGMASFDVFSMNSYSKKIPAGTVQEIHEKLNMPTMIGEFHFGALDAGLPASGIGHVKNQPDRGRAYQIYLENAAANPYCVGVHWFTLYDQSALGRFDGENYNIGFLDVCNRPYKSLCTAARKSHEAVYEIAAGRRKPFSDVPDYLPKLFL
jgi:hypothetical protein